MYSAALTTPMAGCFYRFVDTIYGSFTGATTPIWDDTEELWQANFSLRGGGHLRVTESAHLVEEALKLYLSDYDFKAAMRHMKRKMQAPDRQDFCDRFNFPLEVDHRLGVTRYRDTGVLLPFSMDTSKFSQPNR